MMKRLQDLGGVWRWRRAGSAESHEGIVPGSVLADMLRLGLIEDPFWRTNEAAACELFAEDYIYETNFSVDSSALDADDIRLVFEGLDTIATITLNGLPLAFTNDMHRTFAFDVKGLLRAGENQLKVHLASPLAFIRAEDARNDIFYASTGCLHGNAALRKAHYMFGWDWGPQLPDAGIFRPVYLCFARTAEIADLRLTQRHEAGVTLHIWATITRYGSAPLTLAVEVTAPEGQRLYIETPVPEDGTAVLEAEIPDPQLWWPNGLGGQPLYGVRVAVLAQGAALDERRLRVGLRTVTVSTAPDEWGSEFAFVVNGEKIFAMGANYIPEDSILPRVSAERTRRLVADCAAANFNMLRVWGGGYYPDDAFYDACDECGVLVWQDLMFACNVYRLDEAGDFEQNITAETRDNVRRLRHHACLALWCGNNEMEWGWGDEWARIKGHHPRYKADYIKIFEHILPRVVRENDDSTFWWPSSPSSGGSFDKPNHPDYGDQHYWEVWHSGKPFTEYRSHHFRFCSEYGFQSFPSIKTIRSFTLPEDRNMFSRVMESHQKNGAANTKIFCYVADYFQYPKDLDSIAYISQVLQLKAIQYGVEHWRQNRGRCMGSLYWQLNDCWPVASWASIDYYGRWKALHYGARRFYAPLAASARETVEFGSEITYYLHNDTREAQPCVLEVELRNTSLALVHSLQTQAILPPLSSVPVLTADFAAFLPDEEARVRLFARYRLFQNGVCIGGGTTLFTRPKYFALPSPAYTSEIQESAGVADAFELNITADAFSHYTEVYFTGCDPVPSDNFFDISGPEGVRLLLAKSRLPAGITAEGLRSQLVIRSVRDSYTAE